MTYHDILWYHLIELYNTKNDSNTSNNTSIYANINSNTGLTDDFLMDLIALFQYSESINQFLLKSGFVRNSSLFQAGLKSGLKRSPWELIKSSSA